MLTNNIEDKTARIHAWMAGAVAVDLEAGIQLIPSGGRSKYGNAKRYWVRLLNAPGEGFTVRAFSVAEAIKKASKRLTKEAGRKHTNE